MRVKRLLPPLIALCLLLTAFAPLDLPITSANSLTIPLADLGIDDYTILNGPYDTIDFQFHLPEYMGITRDALLSLELTSVFSSFIPAQGEENYGDSIAGSLEISVNGHKIIAEILQGEGQEITLQIPIPIVSLLANDDRSVEISIFWNGSISCNLNLTSAILFRPGSFIQLEYTESEPGFSLNAFPAPFTGLQSIVDTPTYILVPDPYQRADFEAVTILATGFGRLSDQDMNIHFISSADADLKLLSDGNVIIVGKTSSLSNLPKDFSDKMGSLAVGQGFIGLTNSPFNPIHPMLLITAHTDDDLISIARIAANQSFQAGDPGAFFLADDLSGTVPNTGTQTSFEIQSFDPLTLFDFGKSLIEIPFQIPADFNVGIDATADIVFSHSTLMDYFRSGISVYLNGTAISSIRFSDNTAENATVRILLPDALMKPGENILALDTSIYPLNICTNPHDKNVWLRISENSTITIPESKEEFVRDYSINLNNLFDYFFIRGSSLPVISISELTPELIDQTIQLSFDLGKQTKGQKLFPSLKLFQDLSVENLDQSSIIAIGYTQDIIQSPIYDHLLVDFKDGNAISIPGEIVDNIESDVNSGYVQLLAVDSSIPAFVLLINSLTSSGIEEAVDTLLSSDFNISTNVVIVQAGSQKEFSILAPPENIEEDDDLILLEEMDIQSGKPAWLLPILVLAVISLLVFIGFEVTRYTASRRIK